MRATASCEFPLLEEWKELCEKSRLLGVADAVLSGFAQIAFNDNSFSGLVMIAAVALVCPAQAFSGVVAALAATLVAGAAGVPRQLVRGGLYGFNAALVGLALPVAVFPGQGVTVQMVLYALVGGMLTVFLTAGLGALLSPSGVPALSLPYCVAMLVLVSASVACGSLGASRVAPMPAGLAGAPSPWTPLEFLSASLAGIAQVLWVEEPAAGVMYLVAISFASRVDVLSSVVGALVGTAVAVALGLPKGDVSIGLYGYNAVLLMKVMARGFKIEARSCVLAVACAGATVLVAAGLRVIFAPTGIATFAAWPYVAICVTVFLGRAKLAGLTYVPASEWGVPETLSGRCAEKDARPE